MGRYLRDFRVGERFETRARTITEYDIHQYAQLTGDWNPVHTDEVTAQREHGGRIAHGPLFPGIAFGLLSQFNLIEGTAVALKDLTWEFIAPVHIGDTVRLVMEVTSVSPHPKRTDRGRVGYHMKFLNQRNEVVNHGTATAVMQTGEGETQDG
ncbi:MAG: MaoC/PaaZ C-terminal domain-containing protein [Pseudomonadota bacterium]